MGSPAQPDARQRAALESAGQLQLLESPLWVQTTDGVVRLLFELPLHGVSLIRVDW
jgi:xylan 1,4-beta-xylosidase